MRLRVAAITTGLVITMASVVFSTQQATAGTADRPAGPANLRVIDLHTSGFTIAWDPVTEATAYSVRVDPLEAAGSVSRLTTTELTASFDGLTSGVLYSVSVRAVIANHRNTNASTIIVAVPSPDDYQVPSAPTNLRAERNALGQIELFRWDASTGGSGTLIYQFHLESPGFLSEAVWVQTTGLTADADDLPLCEGCEYDPNQVIYVWVTATDRHNTSPPSERLELTCCPF